MTDPAEMWRPMDTAPSAIDGTEIAILTDSGSLVRAQLAWGRAVDSDGENCAVWIASYPGEHPPCWTDGVCWKVNADGVESDQPWRWAPLPAKPYGGDEP